MEGRKEQEYDRQVWIGWGGRWGGRRPLDSPVDLSPDSRSVATHVGRWLEDWDCRYKQMKRVPSAEQTGSALEIYTVSAGISAGSWVESLLLPIERSQLKWYLIRMPPGHLPSEVFRPRPIVRTPRGRPKTCWRDYLSGLGTPQVPPRRSWVMLLRRTSGLFDLLAIWSFRRGRKWTDWRWSQLN